MRTIEFRGKRPAGNWKYGSYVKTELNDYIIPMHDDTVTTQTAYSVIPETVGQFTGLTDKNGNKIFEGDVLQHHGIVAWNDVELCWSRIDLTWNDKKEWHRLESLTSPLIIIGNIHDND